MKDVKKKVIVIKYLNKKRQIESTDCSLPNGQQWEKSKGNYL